MRTVKEVSDISGISVRTLHHYDKIGLLKPTQVTEAGYRLYDDAALARLKMVLLFRELEFSLAEIRRILDDPGFDLQQALERQLDLLLLRRDRLNDIIAHTRQIQKTGVINMDFTAFDTAKMDEYASKAREKWGHTEAYREFEKKTAGQTKKDMADTGSLLMDIFRQMGEIRHLPPETPEAQELVKTLQNFITKHYYTCTDDILQGLGAMYAAGGEMTDNIDRAGGQGTAAFAQKAIEVYCKG